LGILGVLFVGAICLAGLNLSASAQFESDQSVNLRQQIVGLSSNYLEAGQIATEFLRKHDEKLIEQHAGVLSAALEHLAAAEAFIDRLPEGDPLKQNSALRSGLNLYKTRFQNLVSIQRVLGLKENQGLQGKLRLAVSAVEDKLAQLNEPRLALLMTMMRRHEKDFMLRGEERDGDEFSKRQSEFGDALKASALTDAARNDLSSLMKS
jgi:methyl-accepting chemotaxis protein